jgi:hypothetical protein
MPRYFIDTHDDAVFVEDEDGQDLANAEEARMAALVALPDMARDKVGNEQERTFCACVRDETGAVIYKATLELRGQWGPGLNHG